MMGRNAPREGPCQRCFGCGGFVGTSRPVTPVKCPATSDATTFRLRMSDGVAKSS